VFTFGPVPSDYRKTRNKKQEYKQANKQGTPPACGKALFGENFAVIHRISLENCGKPVDILWKTTDILWISCGKAVKTL